MKCPHCNKKLKLIGSVTSMGEIRPDKHNKKIIHVDRIDWIISIEKDD